MASDLCSCQITASLNKILFPFLEKRLKNHKAIDIVTSLDKQDGTHDIYISLADIIDSETFLEKESFNALMRSEKMPSKNARKNVKHILNSFLLVNTYLEAGHLTYSEQNNRFMLNRPVLNTPAPDVCEYYESIASSMNTCMSFIGFKPGK